MFMILGHVAGSHHLQVLATRREGKNIPRLGSKKVHTLPSAALWSLTRGKIETALYPPDKATEKKSSFVVMDLLNKE